MSIKRPLPALHDSNKLKNPDFNDVAERNYASTILRYGGLATKFPQLETNAKTLVAAINEVNGKGGGSDVTMIDNPEHPEAAVDLTVDDDTETLVKWGYAGRVADNIPPLAEIRDHHRTPITSWDYELYNIDIEGTQYVTDIYPNQPNKLFRMEFEITNTSPAGSYSEILNARGASDNFFQISCSKYPDSLDFYFGPSNVPNTWRIWGDIHQIAKNHILKLTLERLSGDSYHLQSTVDRNDGLGPVEIINEIISVSYRVDPSVPLTIGRAKVSGSLDRRWYGHVNYLKFVWLSDDSYYALPDYDEVQLIRTTDSQDIMPKTVAESVYFKDGTKLSEKEFGGTEVKMQDNPNGGVDLTVDSDTRTLAEYGEGFLPVLNPVGKGYFAINPAVSTDADPYTPGNWSTVFGDACKARANYGIAGGYASDSNGAYAIAIGYYAKATSDHSIAIGANNVANGDSTAIFGGQNNRTQNSFLNSIIGGAKNYINGGQWSFISGLSNKIDYGSSTINPQHSSVNTLLGSNNLIDGTSSSNRDTRLVVQSQTILGNGNLPENDKLLIVGNSPDTRFTDFDESTRSNALTLDWDGNLWVAGKISASEIHYDTASYENLSVSNNLSVGNSITSGSINFQSGTQYASVSPNQIIMMDTAQPGTPPVIISPMGIMFSSEKPVSAYGDTELLPKARINDLLADKQDKLVAGANITIDAETNTISATGGGGGGSNVTLSDNVQDGGVDLSVDGTARNLALQSDLKLKADSSKLAEKQDTLIAGVNIQIADDGRTISATGGGEKTIVEVNPIYTTGTEIATITVDGTSTSLHAPSGGSGSDVTMVDNINGGVDLTVNSKTETLAKNADVLKYSKDAIGTINVYPIPKICFLTQAQYDGLATKDSDTLYVIKEV